MAGEDRYEVFGPCKLTIKQATNNTMATVQDLGYTTNEDLFAINPSEHIHALRATDTGDAAADFVWRGLEAFPACVLAKWNPVAIREFETPPGTVAATTDAGGPGIIGTVYSATASTPRYYTLTATRVTAAAAGEITVVTFPKCIIAPGGVRRFNFGNEEMRVGLRFHAISNGTDVFSYTIQGA